jgi:hypothetical protein
MWKFNAIDWRNSAIVMESIKLFLIKLKIAKI